MELAIICAVELARTRAVGLQVHQRTLNGCAPMNLSRGEPKPQNKVSYACTSRPGAIVKGVAWTSTLPR